VSQVKAWLQEKVKSLGKEREDQHDRTRITHNGKDIFDFEFDHKLNIQYYSHLVKTEHTYYIDDFCLNSKNNEDIYYCIFYHRNKVIVDFLNDGDDTIQKICLLQRFVRRKAFNRRFLLFQSLKFLPFEIITIICGL